tara:strand:+ start:1142 stop:1951 length:810 start_codon:yes stop_codon:yes gene_type:complete
MNYNAIYMVAIDHDNSNFKHSNFSEYSIKSWEYWCKKNNVDFHVITEHNKDYGYPIWNKLDVVDVCDKYEYVGIVDCDTMIKWDAPNIFDTLEDGIYGVKDDINMNWVVNSVENYRKEFFNVDIDLDKYINAGVVFLHHESLRVYKILRDFYIQNKDILDSWNKGGGREQTLFNYMAQTNDFKINLLPSTWNQLNIIKSELIQHNWQVDQKVNDWSLCNPQEPLKCKADHDRTPWSMKYGYITHFTGFPIEHREMVMKYYWDLLGKNYE